MTILHVSDLHFSARHYTWVAAQSPDVLAITGDLLDGSIYHPVSIADQIARTSTWLRQLRPLVAVVSGNHDTVDESDVVDASDMDAGWLRKLRGRNILVDSDQRIVDGYRIVCVPWGHTVSAINGREPVLLLSHDGPGGSAVVDGGGQGLDAMDDDERIQFGDFDLAQICAVLPRGSICLSGHYHTPPAWTGRCGLASCFNPGVGASSASVPNHVWLDTKTGLARLRTSTGFSRTIRLPLPCAPTRRK